MAQRSLWRASRLFELFGGGAEGCVSKSGLALAATARVLGSVDLAGKVADARVDGCEDAADGAPVRAALTALEAADEGGSTPSRSATCSWVIPARLRSERRACPRMS